MAPFSLRLDLSSNRCRTFNSDSMTHSSIHYHCAVRTPGIVSHASLSPKTTPSPKHKTRSPASVSVLTSLVSALKLRSKGKRSAQKVLSPVRSVMAEPDKCHAKEGLQRARSLPPAATQKHIIRCKRISSSADSMEVNAEEEDVGREAGTIQYLYYYDASENPFATPPCTPGPPLSPAIPDNEAEASGSSPDSIQSRRKRRAVERSRLKTLQLLGPEACMAI